MNFTDSATNSILSELNDLEEPLSPDLEELATSVTGSLTNVLQTASGASQAEGDSESNQTSAKV